MAVTVCDFGGCGRRVTREGDRERHEKETHVKDAVDEYRCRCSYASPRRANYIRHLKRCSDESAQSMYHCPCGRDDGQKGGHQSQLTGTCGALETRGRKKRLIIN